MKTLKEVLNQNRPKIYCDMDGVVADFEGQVKKIYGPDKKIEDILPFRNLPGDWFLNLPKMKDADLLMKELKKYDVDMLTGMPGKRAMPYASDHKKQWMKKHYGFSPNKVITVFTSEKPKYAVKNNIANILIDDTIDNIEKWEAKGGIGIYHISASSTINKLNKLLNEEISEDIEYKNNNANGYFAIVLDKKSHESLKKYAIHSIIVAHHVTIAYRPSDYDSRILEKQLNDKFKIKTLDLYSNDNIQAVVVDIAGIKRLNPGKPHITISHTSNAKPVDSNQLITSDAKFKKINLTLNGTLKFIKFKTK